jgi:hypothetical protein
MGGRGGWGDLRRRARVVDCAVLVSIGLLWPLTAAAQSARPVPAGAPVDDGSAAPQVTVDPGAGPPVAAGSVAQAAPQVTVDPGAGPPVAAGSVAQAAPPSPAVATPVGEATPVGDGSIAPRPTARRVFSLTVFPYQVVSPLARMGTVFPVELTGEIRVLDKVGLALIAGAGRHSENIPGFAEVVNLGLDVGLDASYYLLGDFGKGLSVGWELYYWDLVITENDNQTGFSSASESRGATTGGFLGFKYVWPIGFTVEGHVGWGHIWITKGNTFDEPTDTPLLSLKVGWSF